MLSKWGVWQRSFWRSSPQWQLRGVFDGKPVVVGAGPNYGGAIYSLMWGGNQLINTDPAHGGQIQTAYYIETPPGSSYAVNPTEAGSATDTTASTTKILGDYLNNVHLQTICNPAYWGGAYQGSLISPDVLGKTVTLNGNMVDLQYTLVFDGAHPHCALETCWYMPFAFTAYHDGISGLPVTVTPGTSISADHPMVACTADGRLACAIHCPASKKTYGYGYDQKYPKINIYFPELGPIVPGQKFNWEVHMIFGSLTQVLNTLKTQVTS